MSEPRTAIVTGGAGGIGLAIVKRLIATGGRVGLIDLPGSALDHSLDTVGGVDEVEVVAADVTDPAQVAAAVDRIAARFGSIHILANVAGGSGTTRVQEVDNIGLEAWDHVMDLNVRSAFLLCRQVVPSMRQAGFGRIVNFSSVAARGEAGPINTVAGRLPYATAKAALVGFTAQLAKDVAAEGITVNALVPGLILGEPGTRIRDRFDALPKATREQMLGRNPMGRAGSADEVAATVAFLCSEEAAFISGAAIAIDGAA